MKHVNEKDLLDFLGGHLPPQQTQEIRAHLAHCETCQQQLDPMQQAWEELGTWQVSTPPGLDITDRVLNKLPASVSPWRIQRGEWLRLAASILVAIGVGHLSARALRSVHTAPPNETTQTDILEILSLPSATGLIDPLLAEDTPNGGPES